MRRIQRFGALAAAFAAGVVIGSAGLATAAFGKKGWERFGPMFKQGYVAGFIDAVRIAKATEPYSYMASQYPVPPKAKPLDWMVAVDEVYRNERHEMRPMSQVLIIAGHKLETKFGAEPKLDQAKQLERLREAIEKQRRALAKQSEGVRAAQEELETKPAGDAAKDGDKKDDAKGADGATGDEASDAGAAGAQKPPKPEAAPQGSRNDGAPSLPDSPADVQIRKPQADPDAPATGTEQ